MLNGCRASDRPTFTTNHLFQSRFWQYKEEGRHPIVVAHQDSFKNRHSGRLKRDSESVSEVDVVRKFPSRLFFREVEMQAKKLLSCGFAFLLVLTFVGVSSALDVSEVRGMWVRLDKDVGYAKIGETVIVFGNTARALDVGDEISVQIMEPDDDPDTETTRLPVDGAAHAISFTLITPQISQRQWQSRIQFSPVTAPHPLLR